MAKALRLRRLAAAYARTAPGRPAGLRVDVVGVLCRPRPSRRGCATSSGWGRDPRARAHPVGGAHRARRHPRRRRGAHRQGLPCFIVGGLPDAACAQAPERVRAAAATARPPSRRTGSPSTSRRPRSPSGARPSTSRIAVAVLAAAGAIRPRLVEDVVHLGELAPRRPAARGPRRPAGGARGRAARGAARRRPRRERRRGPARRPRSSSTAPRSLAEVVRWYREAAAGRAPPGGRAGAAAARRPGGRAPTSPTSSGSTRPGRPSSSPRPAAHHLLLTGPRGRQDDARRAARDDPAAARPGARPSRSTRCARSSRPVGEVAELDRTPPFVAPHHSTSRRRPRRRRLRRGAARCGVAGPPRRALPRRGARVPVLGPAEPCASRWSRARSSSPGPARSCATRPASCSCSRPTRARAGMAFGQGGGVHVRALEHPRLRRPRCPGRSWTGSTCRCTSRRCAGPPSPRRRGETSAVVAARVAAARAAQAERWPPAGGGSTGSCPGHVLRRAPCRLPGRRPRSSSTARSTPAGSPCGATTGCCGSPGRPPTSRGAPCPRVRTSRAGLALRRGEGVAA